VLALEMAKAVVAGNRVRATALSATRPDFDRFQAMKKAAGFNERITVTGH
jgi:hypothetical protein